MNEVKWLEGSSPADFQDMLRHVCQRDRISPPPASGVASGSPWRKLRLLLCGVWRQQVAKERPRNDAPLYEAAIDIAERYADGRASPEELQAAREVFQRHPDTAGSTMYFLEYGLSACHTALEALKPEYADLNGIEDSLYGGLYAATHTPRFDRASSHDQFPIAFLKENFGNPFRSVPIDAASFSPTIVSIAQAAYDERIMPSGEIDPVRLAVLADALEEIGADQSTVEHLRGLGPHVRGCWVVDLVLGRS
jgi:hypothetical protein